ncbi:chemotaxis protein CheW [Altererythrobacter aerius]|uniref:Chemotaxis protein CheW n=1 Tax=Tsuneonella aeria TaxID=1837929 RepID=A0A6I4TID5_9SPHN|nr:chemotaxis protein CheW [Tsuneonella aeria]MXO75810.1 chemotaxis protein CheW [Tsuneonella aeria]
MTGQVLLMTIAGRRVALPTMDVHSVVELEDVHRVPRAPAHIAGMTALRSSTLTVIDAVSAIGFADARDKAADLRAAVVDHAGHRYALRVQDIEDVAQCHGSASVISADMGDQWARVSKGLVETDRGPALLLDLGALIAGPAA